MPARKLCKAALVLVLALTACRKGPAPVAAVPAVDPATAATLTGVVSFSGTVPRQLPIDMAADPACAFAPTNTTEQIMAGGGKLANVFVYIKAGAPGSSAPASATPVVLDQKGCRYLPHVIAVQQGGTVAFKNSDPTMHNIHTTPEDGTGSDAAGSLQVDMSEMPMSAPQTHTFTTPQTMLPVRCNNHPWMQAYVNVAPNAYFAVTGADGSFTLPRLPPGTYTIAAVHETLGEQDLQVTLAAKSTSKVEFTFHAK